MGVPIVTPLPAPTIGAQLKCNTCLGVYNQVNPDGTLYFHACAPASAQPGQYATQQVNARNENIQYSPAGVAVNVIAPGTGVTVLGGTPVNLLTYPQ